MSRAGRIAVGRRPRGVPPLFLRACSQPMDWAQGALPSAPPASSPASKRARRGDAARASTSGACAVCFQWASSCFDGVRRGSGAGGDGEESDGGPGPSGRLESLAPEVDSNASFDTDGRSEGQSTASGVGYGASAAAVPGSSSPSPAQTPLPRRRPGALSLREGSPPEVPSRGGVSATYSSRRAPETTRTGSRRSMSALTDALLSFEDSPRGESEGGGDAQEGAAGASGRWERPSDASERSNARGMTIMGLDGGEVSEGADAGRGLGLGPDPGLGPSSGFGPGPGFGLGLGSSSEFRSTIPLPIASLPARDDSAGRFPRSHEGLRAPSLHEWASEVSMQDAEALSQQSAGSRISPRGGAGEGDSRRLSLLWSDGDDRRAHAGLSGNERRAHAGPTGEDRRGLTVPTGDGRRGSTGPIGDDQRGYANQSGIDAELRSSVGGGSTLHISTPLRDAASPSEAESVQLASPPMPASQAFSPTSSPPHLFRTPAAAPLQLSPQPPPEIRAPGDAESLVGALSPPAEGGPRDGRGRRPGHEAPSSPPARRGSLLEGRAGSVEAWATDRIIQSRFYETQGDRGDAIEEDR